MNVSQTNGVLVYSVTSAARAALPDWIAKTNKKSLQRDAEYRNRLEIVQDLEFPEASIKIKSTKDGNHIMATGVYQPQMRGIFIFITLQLMGAVFELQDLAMKFKRHSDAENVTFEILTDDWTKSVHLQNDRTIEFHTQFGIHYKTRVPRFGRDLAYSYPNCDLLIGGASSDVWRLNLEQGKFLNPIPTDLNGVNVCEINPAHQLWSFGGEDGVLEFWHPTQRNRIAKLDVKGLLEKSQDYNQLLNSSIEISSMKFADNGLTFAVGMSTGQILLYDLRRPTPVMIKDHQYGYPIKSLSYHNSGNIISADSKIVKIWDKNNGKIFTSVEPPTDINDVLINEDSGLMMVANEGVRIQTYYIPQLGPAPKWCPFLDNMTEELEENQTQTIYDDYKFVTRKELKHLGLEHLIGSNLLRAYMHGFFVDLRLYEKARSIASPFDFDSFKKSQIQSKIEKEKGSRIRAIKNLPKVNKELASKLLSGEFDGKKGKKELPRENQTSLNPLGDDRFSAAFTEEDFAIDTSNPEYILHYPVEKKKAIISEFDKIEEDSEEEISEKEGKGSDESSSEESSFEETKTVSAQKVPKQSFYELKPGAKLKLNESVTEEELTKQQNFIKLNFEEKLKQMKLNGDKDAFKINSRRSGNASLTFTPKNRNARRGNLEDEHSEDEFGEPNRKKRGVKSLGLQGDRDDRRNSSKRGRGRGRG
ncbi:Nucleolar protein 10 [Clydaea vesicula]|uniref:Nucleolar protein 10 n=1 Tax=Clydaea vesicula TaxID=447962 RepID=A0AAD5U824_9FUNG|nr:Nucleolar protein 10 [Clydaea vesicula]